MEPPLVAGDGSVGRAYQSKCDEDGSRLHFLQWYEKWLDEATSRFKREMVSSQQWHCSRITAYADVSTQTRILLSAQDDTGPAEFW